MSAVEFRTLSFERAAPLFAILILGSVSCTSQERGAADSASPAAQVQTRAVDSQPVRTQPAALEGKHPDVSYTVIAPAIDEETPVVDRRLPTAAGQDPLIRNGSIYAAATDLIAVLRPGARVRLSDGHVFVNDRNLGVSGFERGKVVYVPVKAFARQFGAYTLINEVDGSATIWPHDVLLYWRKHGDPRAPVLSEAAAEGIIQPSSK